MTESKRASGYYWVKMSYGWDIGNYKQHSDYWCFAGMQGIIIDDDIFEIDETPITRDINNIKKEKV